MICVKCGTDISDSAKFCPRCGFKNTLSSTEEVALKICPQCGTENPASAKFCKTDGTPLTSQEIPHKDDKLSEKEEFFTTSKEVHSPSVTESELHRVEEELHQKAASMDDNEPVICPICGTINAAAAKFCKKDGTPLKELILHGSEGAGWSESANDPEKTQPIKEKEDDQKTPDPPITPTKVEASIYTVKEPVAEKGIVVCPTCGTPNAPTAKFCKKDGVALKGPHTDVVSVDEKAYEPAPLPKEQAIVPPRENQCVPETSLPSTTEEKRTYFQEPLSEKSVAFSSVGNTENSTTKSNKENDHFLEESKDYKKYPATTAQLSSPYSKEKELDQAEHKVEGDKRRNKMFLITLSVIGCCFILGVFGYYFRDNLMPSSQTPADVSVQSPPTQLEKQTPLTSRQPEQSIQPQPVPEKTPEKSEEVKSIVNKPTQPELKPNKNEDVRPIMNKQLRPELKPISPALSTQKTPVKIRTVPNGASIYIDGQPRGKAPATIMISRGNHQIRVSREGYKDAETKLNVQETMEFPIHISLEPDE